MLPVIYTPAVEKYFKKLRDKNLKQKFKEAIINIRLNPYCGQKKVGNLQGLHCIDIYHKGTNFELAYRLLTLESGKMIVIVLAGSRENFYKELKRYLD